ncbi:MAG: hypothetical protein JSW29_07255 [Candidatus Bathyarchaeota archaeon]|nr:MAG: hypothetical protein JSW29_07255 [Candidatus Bathyarchaeota archaeon]
MQFPLSFADMTLWLAIMSIILLATSELISPYYGRTNLLVEEGRLRAVALTVGIMFILSILVQIYLMAPF